MGIFKDMFEQYAHPDMRQSEIAEDQTPSLGFFKSMLLHYAPQEVQEQAIQEHVGRHQAKARAWH